MKTMSKIIFTGSTNMGSCQCGNTSVECWIENDRLFCTTSGSEKWQQYKGPASNCQVPYGMGSLLRWVASKIKDGTPLEDKDLRGGQGSVLKAC